MWLWGIWLCYFGQCLSSLWWFGQLNWVSSSYKTPGTCQISSCLFFTISVLGRRLAIVDSFIMRRTMGPERLIALSQWNIHFRVIQHHRIYVSELEHSIYWGRNAYFIFKDSYTSMFMHSLIHSLFHSTIIYGDPTVFQALEIKWGMRQICYQETDILIEEAE